MRRSVCEPPDLDELSRSELEVLRAALERACGMTFDQRTAATQGEDWPKAELGWMRDEDMVELDNPRREEILETFAGVGDRMVS